MSDVAAYFWCVIFKEVTDVWNCSICYMPFKYLYFRF